MARRVVIVGTGGMGREAAAWVGDVDDVDAVGFLDTDVGRHGSTVADLEVLGNLEWLRGESEVQAVLAIGSSHRRAELLAELGVLNVPLATIVHPSAVVGPRVRIEDGAIICPGVVLTCDVRVGRAAIVNYGAMVGHDGDLGECCFVAPGAHLAGNVTVGAQADIGIGASVIQGVTIGERAVVGAGAVVIRDVPPDTTVVGVPAEPLPRKR